jgi:hypothetical protein
LLSLCKHCTLFAQKGKHLRIVILLFQIKTHLIKQKENQIQNGYVALYLEIVNKSIGEIWFNTHDIRKPIAAPCILLVLKLIGKVYTAKCEGKHIKNGGTLRNP